MGQTVFKFGKKQYIVYENGCGDWCVKTVGEEGFVNMITREKALDYVLSQASE